MEAITLRIIKSSKNKDQDHRSHLLLSNGLDQIVHLSKKTAKVTRAISYRNIFILINLILKDLVIFSQQQVGLPHIDSYLKQIELIIPHHIKHIEHLT